MEIEKELIKHGYYEQTTDELHYAAQLAWRNTARCSGRQFWKGLILRDCRHVTTVEEMFGHICEHIKIASNGGNIQSVMSVFPPRRDNQPDQLRIWNQQYLSYAGYEINGELIGDKAAIPFTNFCLSLGWKSIQTTRFDFLPLVLSGSDGVPHYFDIPEELIIRVNIKHPEENVDFDDLNLEWYALPAVSSMMLEVGGIQYPTAPFNGWYAVTEIANRDLIDEQRYDLLEDISEALGYDISDETNLWKDKASLEITVAVLHSFKLKGVTISDHHSLASQFMEFFKREYKTRGGCPADWVWIVPPISGSLVPTFHQEMLNYKFSPSFEYQDPLFKPYLKKYHKKITFKNIAIASVFCSILFFKRYKERKEALVLYGTMTGTARSLASKYVECLNNQFRAKLLPIDDNTMKRISTIDSSKNYILTCPKTN